MTHLVMAEQPHYRSYILVLISTYQVSSAWLECRALQRKIVKVLMRRPGIEPGTPRLPGECSNHWAIEALYFLCSPNFLSIIVLNCRHPYMRCDASSDTRATALPVIYICSHFDLSSLISMARMQSAPKEDSKSFCVPTRDRTRDLSLSGQVL